MNTLNKVEIIVGRMDNELENEITKDKLEKYKPFILTFKSFEDFIKWLPNKKKPILKEAWYIRIYEELRYNIFITNLEQLKEIDLKYIFLQYFVTPKDKFTVMENLSTESINVTSAYKLKRKIVDETLDEILEPAGQVFDVDTIKSILIQRVGYNIEMLKLYARKVLELEVINTYYIRKIVPKRKSPPVERIVFQLLKRDKWYIKDYYELCERYSINWANDYIISILNNAISYKLKIKTGEVKYYELRDKDYLKNLVPIIRDIPLSSIYSLKKCIKKYDYLGVETFLITKPINVIDKMIEKSNIENYEVAKKRTVISYE